MRSTFTKIIGFTCLTLFLWDGAQAQSSDRTYSNFKLSDQEFKEANSRNHQKTSSTTLSNCTDLVDFVGSTPTYYDNIGGGQQNSSQYKALGVYMIYPPKNGSTYKGSVLGVVFTARAGNANANANLIVEVVGTNNASTYATGALLSSGNVMVSGSAVAEYTVMFSSPALITSNTGFAVGIYAATNADSCRVYEGANMGSTGPAYGNVLVYPNILYTYANANRINVYPLLRPIITTTVNPTWVSAKTSTGCGAPAVYNFTNTTTATTPSYVTNSIISPTIPNTSVLDYGDGSTVASFSNGSTKTHSYTALGSYTAAFTETYHGWNGDCAVTLSVPIVVNNPLPSFTYNTNGLTVNLNNTSGVNFSSFVWNFGDLSTSTQDQPGSHTFSAPGTYVIELEGTTDCGKVRFSVSVTVPSSATGIAQSNGKASDLISLAPNPANTLLKISSSNTDEINSKITIFNSTGVMLKSIDDLQFDSGRASIDVSEFTSGIYFIKFSNGNSDIVKSFIKE